MRLYEQGKIDLNKTLGDYLPITKGTNKEYCLLKDLLMHQAGMKSWIPFYRFFKDSSADFKEGIFNNYKTKLEKCQGVKGVIKQKKRAPHRARFLIFSFNLSFFSSHLLPNHNHWTGNKDRTISPNKDPHR
jgi:hypothetical protein